MTTSVSRESAPKNERVASSSPSPLGWVDGFVRRHIGPSDDELLAMLRAVGYASLDALADAAVPESIRLRRPLALGPPRGEYELLAELHALASENQVFRSMIGLGYHDTITPPVILRNVLESPGWYTQYTPYQAEISQGRLEALLNFQTMIADLTGLPLAGASLLDEATAAAEAMAMCFAISGHEKHRFLIADDCHPQTIAVTQTRAGSLGIDATTIDATIINESKLGAPSDVCGVLLSYPTTDGKLVDWRKTIADVHAAGALVVLVCDPLALAICVPPGELGADIAVGSAQRFGVPMGAGGPHAGFLATKSEHARRMPGRIIGVSRDAHGRTAYRMAIQTREQHIKREKATSNICTAQALLAITAGFYGVYHGPDGLRRIARRVHACATALARGLEKAGHSLSEPLSFFDTIRVRPAGQAAAMVLDEAHARGVNLRDFGDGTVGMTCDETTSTADLLSVLSAFGTEATETQLDAWARTAELPAALARTSDFMSHPVFHQHHSETELLRYVYKLQSRDLSLAHAMIPLGSCTMKLNATSEMLPVTWPEFARIHPFAPPEQTRGYAKLYRDLETWLSEITGFAATSLQPNAGSQGEYAGLLVVRAYHASRGEGHRDVCLIPTSAHGTNPASAVIAGLRVIAVACDERGNVRVDDLRAKAKEHEKSLAALMITYPSTHGVFEEGIKEICELVHAHGGQVYMDGANMNAQVGLCRPGDIGADVCHLNLHKTFCIPHGGGGPGMGPISVAAHLAPFLPTHPVVKPDSAGAKAIGAVSAAPYGSPMILPISWVYIALMGASGLKKATEAAILAANYVGKRLQGHYPTLYTGKNGLCAHELILDCRGFKKAGIEVDDIAKRLMDYGFHAPTMSFPVPGTLMVEPTESEPLGELDRFCDAMIAIREEIRAVEEGRAHKTDNVLCNSPHTMQVVAADAWSHPYSREQAAFPLKSLRDSKQWPTVSRIDNPYGDRHLICTCPPMEEVAG